MSIGLQFSAFQRFQDKEQEEKEEKARNNLFKSEVETNKRILADLKLQKKKDMEAYEHLEQHLTKFELEEEDEIKNIMNQSQQKRQKSLNTKDLEDFQSPTKLSPSIIQPKPTKNGGHSTVTSRYMKAKDLELSCKKI